MSSSSTPLSPVSFSPKPPSSSLLPSSCYRPRRLRRRRCVLIVYAVVDIDVANLSRTHAARRVFHHLKANDCAYPAILRLGYDANSARAPNNGPLRKDLFILRMGMDGGSLSVDGLVDGFFVDAPFDVEFLRTVGAQVTVNRMLSFESVKQRLGREQPLSFLEFNYMLLQAYDFLELYRREGVELQLGGSDQWCNSV